LNSFDADGDRASQLQHAIQDPDGDGNFGGTTPIFAKAQAISDHLLVTSDAGLNAAARVVARRLLPPYPALLGNALQVASRCVGSVSAVSLNAAVERGGTMTTASGARLVTASQTLS